jgi:3',5'-cyclic-AMP phosphodiesterase
MIIAQISDTHLANKNGMIERKGEHALERAIVYINGLPAIPDVVLLTGDCADHGDPAEYERAHELLKSLPMPVYVIPGNHDDRIKMLEVFGAQGTNQLEGFMQYVVDDGPVRLIALDTNIPGRDQGQLCAARMAWLEARLSEQPDRPTVLFMHHPPFPTGVPVSDDMGFMDADVFGQLIQRHRQVEAILAGHVHSTFARRFYGTIAVTCGSTAYQMTYDSRRPNGMAVTMEPPVCLLHTWKIGTGLLTHTSLIGDPRPVELLHDGEKWRS